MKIMVGTLKIMVGTLKIKVGTLNINNLFTSNTRYNTGPSVVFKNGAKT